MTDPREQRLNALAERKQQLVDSPYSTERSREVDWIDAEIDSIWAEIGREALPWR